MNGKKLALKITRLIVASCVLTGVLAGCSKEAPTKQGLSIVTTIFPVYDWTQQVIGANTDQAQATLLQDAGIDPHNFQPSAEDIVAILNCDIFVYVGGHSDGWVEQVLRQINAEDKILINLMELFYGEGEPGKEGAAQEHQHSGEDCLHHSHHVDEHVWLSLHNCKTFVAHIAQILAQQDAAHENTYQENAIGYIKKIGALDQEYKRLAATYPDQTLIFADQFPFRHLMEDYGIQYYAAFDTCSSDSQASFETMALLTEKAQEHSVLLTTENPFGNLAEAIIESSGNRDIEILALHSLQSIGSKELQGGASYVSLMEENLQVLTRALQKGKAP